MTEEEKRARLSRMRLVALAVLAAMFAVFAASSMWQGSIPALQWLRAFSEAGIAGAIADWYAVVALFRHPLGLAAAAHRDHSKEQRADRRKHRGFHRDTFPDLAECG